MVTQRTETVVLLLTRELERTKTLRNWLDAAHFTTITAVPGDVGVARAEAEQPDAIVLYVTGPGPEALALCEELRDAAPTHLTPLLLWSEQPFTHEERLVALQAEIREPQFRLEFRFVGAEGFARRDALAKPIPALEWTGDGDLHRICHHR